MSSSSSVPGSPRRGLQAFLSLLPFPSASSLSVLSTHVSGSLSLFEVPPLEGVPMPSPRRGGYSLPAPLVPALVSSVDLSPHSPKKPNPKKNRKKKKKKPKSWACCELPTTTAVSSSMTASHSPVPSISASSSSSNHQKRVIVASCHSCLHLVEADLFAPALSPSLRLRARPFDAGSEIYCVVPLINGRTSFSNSNRGSSSRGGVPSANSHVLVGCRDGRLLVLGLGLDNRESTFVERCSGVVEEDDGAPVEVGVVMSCGFGGSGGSDQENGSKTGDVVGVDAGDADADIETFVVVSCNDTVVLWEVRLVSGNTPPPPPPPSAAAAASASASTTSSSSSTMRRLWTYASERDVGHICMIRPYSSSTCPGLMLGSLVGGGAVLLAVFRDRIYQLQEWDASVVPDVTSLAAECAGRFVAAALSPQASKARGGVNVMLFDTRWAVHLGLQRRRGGRRDGDGDGDARMMMETSDDDAQMMTMMEGGRGCGSGGADVMTDLDFGKDVVLEPTVCGEIRLGRGVEAMSVSFVTRSDSEIRASCSVSLLVGTSKGSLFGWKAELDDPLSSVSVSASPPSLAADAQQQGTAAMDVDREQSPRPSAAFERYLRLCSGRIRWKTETDEPVEARCSMVVLSRRQRNAEAMVEDVTLGENEIGEIVTLSGSKRLGCDVGLIECLLAGRSWDQEELLFRVASGGGSSSEVLLVDYFLFFSELGLPEEASIISGLIHRIREPAMLLSLLKRSLLRFEDPRPPRPSFLEILLRTVRRRLPQIEGDSSLLMLLDMKTFALLKHSDGRSHARSDPHFRVCPFTCDELFRRRLAMDPATGRGNAALVSCDARSREPVHLEVLMLRSGMMTTTVLSPGDINTPFDAPALKTFVDLLYLGLVSPNTPVRTFLQLLKYSSFLKESLLRLVKRAITSLARKTNVDVLQSELLQHGHLIDDMSLCSLFVGPRLSQSGIVRLVQESGSAHALVGIQTRLKNVETVSARNSNQLQILQGTLSSLVERVVALEGRNAPKAEAEDDDDDVEMKDDDDDDVTEPAAAAAAVTEPFSPGIPNGEDEEEEEEEEGEFSLPKKSLEGDEQVQVQVQQQQQQQVQVQQQQQEEQEDRNRKRKRTDMESQPLPPQLPPSMAVLPPAKKRKIEEEEAEVGQEEG